MDRKNNVVGECEAYRSMETREFQSWRLYLAASKRLTCRAVSAANCEDVARFERPVRKKRIRLAQCRNGSLIVTGDRIERFAGFHPMGGARFLRAGGRDIFQIARGVILRRALHGGSCVRGC